MEKWFIWIIYLKISKNQFKFICFNLHLLISDDDFKDDNDINEIKEENQGNENNDEEKDDENIKENEQRKKVFIFINTIINNNQKYFKL